MLDGKKSSCKVCCIEYTKEYLAKRKAGHIPAKRRCDKLNPFKQGTIESDLWTHMFRFNVILTTDEINVLSERLKLAYKENKYFEELDRIELEHGCKRENYEVQLLQLLREGREIACSTRVKHANMGCDVRVKVRQLDLEGNYIADFDSLRDASMAISNHPGKCVGAISHCCSGVTTKAFNFIWEYL